jgi:hypothetical protein
MVIQFIFQSSGGSHHHARSYFKIRKLDELLGKDGYKIYNNGTHPACSRITVVKEMVPEIQGPILEIEDDQYAVLIRLNIEQYTNLKIKAVYNLDEVFLDSLGNKKTQLTHANKLAKKKREYGNVLASYQVFLKNIQDKVDRLELKQDDPLYSLKAEVQKTTLSKKTTNEVNRKIKQLDNDIDKIRQSVAELFEKNRIR